MKKVLLTAVACLFTLFAKAQDPCDCNLTFTEPLVCVEDTLGNQFLFFDNPCVLTCFQFSLIDSSFCSVDTSDTVCDCPIDIEEPYVCAVDSNGVYCQVPNACWAACLGLEIVDDSACEDGSTIDTSFLTCLDEIDFDSISYLQQLVLALEEKCQLGFPECFINAPTFNNDSLYLTYIIENCGLDSLGMLAEASGLMASQLSSTNQLHSDLVVYPNPCSDRLSFDFNEGGTKTIEVFDALGKRVIVQASYNNAETIDVSFLLPALYLVKVQTDSGNKNYTIFKQ